MSQKLAAVRDELQEMIDERNFSHASASIYPRVILDMHEEEWSKADEELKAFVKDNNIVVETWT